MAAKSQGSRSGRGRSRRKRSRRAAAIDVTRRRELRRRLAYSLLGHLLAVGALAATPPSVQRPLPPVVTIDLVAAPRPAPAPSPAPAPKPAPAPPAPKKTILPRDPAPVSEKKVAVAKPKPRRPRPEELDYEDALSKLREELGEDTAAEAPEAEPTEVVEGEAVASPEYVRWVIDVKRHVRATFVTPPEFTGRGLRTCLTVILTSSGDVLGTPRVDATSGDPFWDDNAARAILRATPLPPPPEPGSQPFCFAADEVGR